MMPEMPIPPDFGRHVAGIPAQDDAPPDPAQVQAAGGEVIELDDGSAIVMDPAPPEAEASEFYDNLAESLDESVLTGLASKYIELINLDRRAREKRMEAYADTISRTGMGGKAPGGADFPGASDVTHPLITEATVDFEANAIRELFPASGPVRAEVKGLATRERALKAVRKAQFMNWQLTKQVPAYREELERLLTQLPMGGSGYQKWWMDRPMRRPRCEFVRIDDVLVPFSAASFYTARRVTVELHLNEEEFEERVASGMYRDVSSGPPAIEDEVSAVEEAARKVEGKEFTAYNEDGQRLDHEIYCYLKIEDSEAGEGYAPYVMTISHHDERVLSIYRNWEQSDPLREKLDWLVDWTFVPWDGVYGLGWGQLLAGIPKAATGALRALLDSAHVNNVPAGVKLKGGRTGGQTVRPNPGEIAELEAAPGVDDIRKLAMQFPFNQPSPVLFQLLGLLTDYGKGIVTTAEEKIKDATSTMPVGTALALIEQGSKVLSAIHARLHASQARSLAILSRINRMFFTDQELAEAYGEPLVTREDFRETSDVVPVSDPAVFSEGQRYAQAQAALGMSADQRVQYNLYEVHRFALERMKFPEIDRILPPPPKPTEMNSVAENLAAASGKPLAAFPDQDHLSHVEVHLRFCTSAFMASDPQAVMRIYPAQLEHIRQHFMFFYARLMHDLVSQAAGQDLDEILKDPRNYKQLDAAFAAASEVVGQKMSQAIEATQVLPMLTQMMQMVQQLTPPPQDPAMATVEAAMKETERRAARDKEEMALANQDMAEKSRQAMVELRKDLEQQMADRQQEMEKSRLAAAEAAASIRTEQEKLDLDKRRFSLEALEKIAEIEAQVAQMQQVQPTPVDEYAKIIEQFGQRLDQFEMSGKAKDEAVSTQLKMMTDGFGTLVKHLGSTVGKGQPTAKRPAKKKESTDAGENTE